jgi:hypothetical protein
VSYRFAPISAIQAGDQRSRKPPFFRLVGFHPDEIKPQRTEMLSTGDCDGPDWQMPLPGELAVHAASLISRT